MLAPCFSPALALPGPARFYPQDAFLVPLSRKAELQSLLDQHRVIRLEPGDYQKGNPAASILVRSGYRIYGLQNNLPTLRIEPGTEGAVISAVHATLLFPAGSAVTRRNLFQRTTFSKVKVENAKVEDNLFLDATKTSVDVDTRAGGWFRNNRFIRYGVHEDASPDNPPIRFRGDAARLSGGNVFVAPIILGNPSAYFDNQYSLTLIGLSAEGYHGGGYPVVQTGPMGLLNLWKAGGLISTGRGLLSDADETVLFGYDLNTKTPPAVSLGRGQGASMYLNHFLPLDRVAYGAPGFRVEGMDAGGEIAKQIAVDGVRQTQPVSGVQAGKVRSMLMKDRGERWEPPVFDPIPDPAGTGWDRDRAQKPSSSAYIQGLIDREGIAILPAGTYYIDKPIVLGRRGKGLIGAGMDSTVLIAKSQDVDIIVMDSIALSEGEEAQPGLMLADLTLQGGRNGVFQTWKGGKNLQFYDLPIVSHVTFRDMREAGIQFTEIYAWDNVLLDNLNFSGCASGFKQATVIRPGVDDYTPTLNYVDKVMFYHCRFAKCGRALDMVVGRASNDNWFVNSRFEDNSEYVWRSNHTNLYFVNCDVVNNGGNPVIHNDGPLFIIGSRFVAGPRDPGSLLDAFSNLSIAESHFGAGGAVKTAVLPAQPPAFLAGALTNPDNRRHYENMRINFFNSASDIPLGLYRNGLLFNNDFKLDTALSREWAYMDTSRLTVLMADKGSPKAQLLAGSVFPDGLSSGGGAGIAAPGARAASGPWTRMRVVRNSGHALHLAPAPFPGAAAGALPDRIELFTLRGTLRAAQRVPPGTALIRFEGLTAGVYRVRMRYGFTERTMLSAVVQ